MLFNKKAISNIPVIPFTECAAKSVDDDVSGGDKIPGTLVYDHCLAAGYVGRFLYDRLTESVKKSLSKTPGLSVAFHDVGKVSPGFQLKYFRDTIVAAKAPELLLQTGFNQKHASIGASAVDGILGEQFAMKQPVSRAIAGHHGICDKSYNSDTAEINGGKAWADERRKLCNELSATLEEQLEKEPYVDAALQAGLISVADWISSDETYFPPDKKIKILSEQALKALEGCGFTDPVIRKGLSFNNIFGFEPNSVQQAFLKKVQKRGVYILEAPMGIGKTEAALAAAYGLIESGINKGIYFALPTKLTSDKIHERVQSFIKSVFNEEVSVRLAHGAAWLDNYGMGGEELKRSWFNPAKRALLDNFAVGTIDQALLSVMNVKFGFVRLFGLAGKVVILDEVHSYDVYTGTLLNELVARLLSVGCTVIILSATLTEKRRRELLSIDKKVELCNDYPILTGKAQEDNSLFCERLPLMISEKKVHIEKRNYDGNSTAAYAIASARNGNCVICIANTVAKAQEWYSTIMAKMREGEFPVGLLHSRFPAIRRAEIEDEWMTKLGKDGGQRPNGCILVSTQIVEQSVDIDADEMITELAPIDMLLQRAGRLWRHNRNDRPAEIPVMTIVCGDLLGAQSIDDLQSAVGKGSANVYAPYVLLRTAEVLNDVKLISIPSDIRTLIETVYLDREEKKPFWIKCLEELKKQREKLAGLALAATSETLPTRTDDEEKAGTRYGDYQTIDVLLLKNVCLTKDDVSVELPDGRNIVFSPYKISMEAVKMLHKWIVRIPRYWLPKDLPKEDVWVSKYFYSTPTLLTFGSDQMLLNYLDGSPTCIMYCERIGISRNNDEQYSQSSCSFGYDSDENSDFNIEDSQW